MNPEISKNSWVCQSCKTTTPEFTATNSYLQLRCWACGAKQNTDIIIIPPEENIDPAWICKVCYTDNLLGQINCIKCHSPKINQECNQNDWMCVLCHAWNFNTTEVCLDCGCSKYASIPDYKKTSQYSTINPNNQSWKCTNCKKENLGTVYYCTSCNFWKYYSQNHSKWANYSTTTKSKIKFFKYKTVKKEKANTKPKISKMPKKKK